MELGSGEGDKKENPGAVSRTGVSQKTDRYAIAVPPLQPVAPALPSADADTTSTPV
jgi:hypothetical protein